MPKKCVFNFQKVDNVLKIGFVGGIDKVANVSTLDTGLQKYVIANIIRVYAIN